MANSNSTSITKHKFALLGILIFGVLIGLYLLISQPLKETLIFFSEILCLLTIENLKELVTTII